MAAMPFFIARLGVKRMLHRRHARLGAARTWPLRALSLPAVMFGLFLHGVCYDFYFRRQLHLCRHARRRAAAGQRQSFIAFVMLGVGMFVGSIASGQDVDHYPPLIQVKAEVASKSKTTEALLPPEWDAAGNRSSPRPCI